MTIAVGILAPNGAVIAADRQETAAYQKGEEGKITTVWRADPPGCLTITGAGDGFYIDSISAVLRDWFGSSKEKDIDKLRTEADVLTQEFYKSRVIPISDDPNLRPDYELLLVCKSFARMQMWKTSRLAFNRSPMWDAVGVGQVVATALINKLWLPVSVEEAVNLAAFTVYEVKASVDGCGLGTDVVFITNDPNPFVNGVPVFLEDAEIREMEDIFRRYHKVEREMFHQCVAHATSVHTRDVFEKYKDERPKMSEAFKEINERRRSRFGITILPAKIPRPSS
jgi:hypothetical protein